LEDLELDEGILCLLFNHVESEILGNPLVLRVVSEIGVGINDVYVDTDLEKKGITDCKFASLDAIDPGHLPYNHHLNSMPNCLFTPHICSATRTTRKRMAEIACENLLAGLDGIKLPLCANPEIYNK
jgi:D-isomer specific 2-hydroxyacid dehydrogenase, catalytic domain